MPDLTDYLGINAHHTPDALRESLHKHFTESRIAKAAFTIITCIGLSEFGSAPGVELEAVFSDTPPELEVNPRP